MKTQEELNALKKEVESLNEKLAELTEEELAEVSGGRFPPFREKPRVIESDVISTVGFKTKIISFSDLSAPLK